MDSNPPAVSRTASLAVCLVLALALALPWLWLHNRAGFIYSFAGNDVAAYIGGFAMLLVAGILVGIVASGLFICRWWRTGLFCLACMAGLIATAQGGRVPCTPTEGLPAYDCVLAGESHHFVWDKTFTRRSGKQKSSPETLHAAWIFGLGFLLVTASGAAAVAIYFWRNARNSVAWPSVQGQIRHARVGHPASVRGQSRQPVNWSWRIAYRYSVDGSAYEGERAYFGAEPTLAVARDIVEKFPESSMVNVYYHPQRHGRSVLLPGVNKFTRTGLLLPALLYAAALLLWLYP